VGADLLTASVVDLDHASTVRQFPTIYIAMSPANPLEDIRAAASVLDISAGLSRLYLHSSTQIYVHALSCWDTTPASPGY